MDYNKLSSEEILQLYSGVDYWCYKFPCQFVWLLIGFFASYLVNGGILIQISIIIYFIIGVYLYCYYKEIEKFLRRNNPFRKNKENK